MECDDSDDPESGSDAGSETNEVIGKRLFRTGRKPSLKVKSLDTVAELFSREKPRPGKKTADVAVSTIVRTDDEINIPLVIDGEVFQTDRDHETALMLSPSDRGK